MGDPVIAAANGLVLLHSNTFDYTTAGIVAHDAKTGAIRWSSKLADLPKPTGGPSNRISLLITHKDGKEYAILASTGTAGGDAVNNGGQVTQLAVYDAATSGDQVAPLRVITVPGLAGGYSTLRDSGTVLVQLGKSAAVADVATGQITASDTQKAALTPPIPCPLDFGDCSENAKIIGQTAAGPLVQGYTAFWSKGWISNDVVPQGAKAQFSDRTVIACGTPGGQVVAQWPQPTDSTTDVIWAVHDGQTGKVLTTVLGVDRPAHDPMDDRGEFGTSPASAARPSHCAASSAPNSRSNRTSGTMCWNTRPAPRHPYVLPRHPHRPPRHPGDSPAPGERIRDENRPATRKAPP